MDQDKPLPEPARRPHLLYVSWGFPPSRGAGVYRALATANYFARNGWEVTVLTANRETFEHKTGVDPRLESEVDPGVKVTRVPFTWATAHPDITAWGRLRMFSDPLTTFLRSRMNSLAFPEPAYGGWMRAIIRQARKIHELTPIDLVIGTANPNVDFAPGYYLQRKFDIPFVMDNRDAWNMDVWTGRLVGSKRSRRLESKMMSRAAEVWFVNQPIAEWHAALHPAQQHKIHVVSNAFDESFTRQFADHTQQASAESLTFGYLGTIYGAIPLREFLEGWRLARTQSAALRSSRVIFRGRLGHYAEADPNTLRLLKEYEHDGVHYGGPVSKVEVADAYRTFDALLLILGSSRFVTSGKVFEYAATGLPIASIHEVQTAATTVLSGYPLLCATESLEPESIARTLIEVAELAQRTTTKDANDARQWAAHLARERQLEPREAALRAAVGKISGQG